MAVEQSIGKFRHCKKCGVEKDLSEFNKHPHCKEGRLHACRECLRRPTHTVPLDPNRKRCSKCGLTQPLDCFGLDPRRSHGRKTYCKKCKRLESKLYRDRNPEASAEATKSWARRNPDKRRAKFNRWRSIPKNRVSLSIYSRINSAIAGNASGVQIKEILGYSFEDLAAHLERQFSPGMSWDTHGKWHIDHIIPLSSFAITSADDPELKRAWALSNLRPLWAKENLRKGSRQTHLI